MMRDNATATTWHSAPASECLSEIRLLRYLQDEVDDQEARVIEQHLDQCPICFGTIGSVRYNQANPFTEAEKARAEAQCKVSPAEQVREILTMYRAVNPPEPVPPDIDIIKGVIALVIAVGVAVREQLKQAVEKTQQLQYRSAFTFAAALIVMVGGSLWGVRYYQTGYQVHIAKKLLEQNHRIFYESARLAGNYGSTGIDKLMGLEQTYADQAREHLERALANGGDTTEVLRLLAHSLMFQGRLSQADSILGGIELNKLRPSAAVLNDIGVLHIKNGDWLTAAKYFAEAIALDPKLKEAYFNEALAKHQLGDTKEAIVLMERYHAIEKDEGWKNAAENLLAQWRLVAE